MLEDVTGTAKLVMLEHVAGMWQSSGQRFAGRHSKSSGHIPNPLHIDTPSAMSSAITQKNGLWPPSAEPFFYRSCCLAIYLLLESEQWSCKLPRPHRLGNTTLKPRRQPPQVSQDQWWFWPKSKSSHSQLYCQFIQTFKNQSKIFFTTNRTNKGRTNILKCRQDNMR